ncbi:hypothetical protein PS2_032212 [Malus domestica]
MAFCYDVVGMSHILPPLSYFGTPHLRRTASRCARGVGSPRWSAALGRSSNWQPAGAGGICHLDWKSLDDGLLHVWWKCSGLQVQSFSPKRAFMQKKSGSLKVALEWIGSWAGSSDQVSGRVGPTPASLGSAWSWAFLAVRLPHPYLLAEWLGLGPLSCRILGSGSSLLCKKACCCIGLSLLPKAYCGSC